MSTIDGRVTAEQGMTEEDDWYQTPPTSRHQSLISLASSARSVYHSALDLLEGDDDMDDDTNADDELNTSKDPSHNTGEKGKEVYYSPLNESDDEETADTNDEPYHVPDTAPLTHLAGRDEEDVPNGGPEVDPEAGVPLTGCLCLLCDLHHRAKHIVDTKLKFLVCALKCSDLNCPNYNELTQEELLSWLETHKDEDSNTVFVQKCYRGDKPWCNVIQKEQSQIFFFFYMLLYDVLKLSSNREEKGHETYPHHDSFLEWMQECEHVMGILLQASFTHADSSTTNFQVIEQPFTVLMRIKESHENQDYIGISFEDTGLEDAIAEVKRLRKKLAGKPSRLQKLMALAAIVMFIADIGTDIFQVVTYGREGNKFWIVMLLLIIGPSLLSTILCFAQLRKETTETKKEKTLKRLGIVLVSLQLGQVWRNICEICDRYPIVDSYIVLNLLLIKMIEGLLEGGPQSLVQTYVLMGSPHSHHVTFTTILKYASPLLSSLSMAAALTDLDLGRAGYCIPVKARLLSILCRLGEVWGRFVAYAVCFWAFQYYGFLLFLVQFLVMTIPTYVALRRDHTENSSQNVNCVYLRCRYGGFYQEKPRKLFTARIPRMIVWFCITVVYSFVPIQRFELDLEFNLRQSTRLPFWKCSRSFGLYNVLYTLHQLFNITAYTLFVTLGGGSSHRLFIPISILFILGTLISVAFRLQSWVGRTYRIALRPGLGAIG